MNKRRFNDLSEAEQIFVLSLSRISFLSFEEKRILEKNLDSYADIVLLSKDDIAALIKRDLKRVVWDGKENLRCSEIAGYYCKKMNIQVLLYSDAEYPYLLRNAFNPPYLLFCRGNTECLNNKSVSVVGTRRITRQGMDAAVEFSYDAALDGCNVVSGLANGVDGHAHLGCINAYFDLLEKNESIEHLGKTIAVLPGSIDSIIPYNHTRLAANILKSGGCIVSEYEPAAQMAKWHFIERNRIIAAFSPATVVIQAPCGSGALITADFALDFNRDVFFHSSAFSELAMEVNKRVEQKLDVDFAKGKVSRYKRENTVQKFLLNGAPVICDYKDYCAVLGEQPGIRSSLIFQKELF
ncbi:MAG: DNA-processing protein DprA [Treponema sp.]|nr:DNA-processing protein DprA [Treponema sp.]